jgi:hypothetical protein
MAVIKGYEAWATVAFQAPIDANNADITLPSSATGIDMSLWDELLVIIEIGVTAGTVALDLRDSPTTNGSYTAIAGKTKTTLATDDGNIYIIALNVSELNPLARFVRAYQDNNAASQLMAILILGKAVNPPATDNKLAAQQAVID